ncbi:conserved hypothetical protein [Verticillium alfalfae VaMs.102]|uniref:DUF7357 domain-containing protein n=1 Tax=Verticillium alfalfae (strain VaMs.102 / ATCC MYA-4576 / FGSC 10136) TaxID=526221 RepID=C9S9H2_VERA1|nr:conserved hypothetical protein [Verticillium alfalfae VaMs.102]EEY16035.1 conserved hypothetical protein [Verticillium alfalfae VaMs.102]
MSDKELRLRLLVRRHGVPEVKLVWNVPTGPDWTIAKLIAQVDEAIPLESGEWGLEDYAVELRGTDGEPFECLHFQQVSKVLKDDDQVIIRSLLTEDIKRRRLSGRHQVSFDGKHLVDGLAFGRPWLRTPRDRPQVELPPRKRARLTWESDDDAAAPNPPDGSDEDADRSPLLIEYDKDDRSMKGHSKNVRFHAEQDKDSKDITRDEEGAEDEFGADDFQSGSESSDSESVMEDDEASLLDELRDIQEDHAAVEGDHEDHEVQLPPHQVQQISESPLQPQLVTVQAWIASLRISFPEKSVEEISQALIESHYDTWEAYRRLDRQLYLQQDQSSPVRPSNPGPPDVASISSSSSASSSSDSSSESDSDLDTRNKPRERLAIDSDEDSDDDSDFDADDANDDSSSSDSSSDSSDSSSSDSEDSDHSPSKRTAISRKAVPVSTIADGDLSENDDTVIRYPMQDTLATEISEEDSSSSSSDSSSDDSSSESEPEELTSKAPISLSSKQAAVSAPQPSSSVVENDDQPLVPPGRGMRKTQKRNLRRRLAKKMASRDQSELSINEPSAASTPDASKSREEAEFLARKKALLDMMEVDTSVPSASPLKLNKYPESAPADLSGITSPSTSPVGAVENIDGPSEHLDATSSAASRRTKLNVDAGRRMLFGALGLRNPKTKADEEKLRTRLMKDVRPHINPRVTDAEGSQAAAVVQATEEVEEEDPDAWRQKINCSAVECCDEGIVLSEPPFPFVQRWDPQQQYDPSQKKGKRKRPQRNASQFYQEDDSQAWKKQRNSLEMTVTMHHMPQKGTSRRMILFSSTMTLPKKRLHQRRKPKQIDMSQGNDGADLRLLLAMRDRGLDKPEKTYDQGTGKRIYDKFEAPDIDEDEDEDEVDDGYRDVQFNELIEPKILLAAGTQKQDGWTDSVVRETQSEEGRDRDERLVNGYEDQMMTTTAEQPVEADGMQGDLGSDSSAAVLENAASPTQQNHEEEDANRHAQPRSTRSSPVISQQIGSTAEQPSASEEVSHNSRQYHDTIPSPRHAYKDLDGLQDGQPSQQGDNHTEDLNSPPGSLRTDLIPADMTLAATGAVPPPGVQGEHGFSDSTPKAKALLKTPSKNIASETPSPSLSLPSVSEIWATAASHNSHGTQSPARTTAESILIRKILKDEEYEEAMRRIDDEDEGEEALLGTPKKRLFSNTPRPADGQKPDFQIPPGSQVITLSSDRESQGKAEQHEKASLDEAGAKGSLKGALKGKKNQAQRKKEAKSRAVSMPTKMGKLPQKGRTSVSATVQSKSAAKSGKGRRAASAMRDALV